VPLKITLLTIILKYRCNISKNILQEIVFRRLFLSAGGDKNVNHSFVLCNLRVDVFCHRTSIYIKARWINGRENEEEGKNYCDTDEICSARSASLVS
jgi:hypothetical protein